MLLTEYNEAKTMEMFKEEGREEGRKEGREEGRKEGLQAKAREVALNMYKRGMKPTDIAEILNEALNNVKQWLGLTTA